MFGECSAVVVGIGDPTAIPISSVVIVFWYSSHPFSLEVAGVTSLSGPLGIGGGMAGVSSLG